MDPQVRKQYTSSQEASRTCTQLLGPASPQLPVVGALKAGTVTFSGERGKENRGDYLCREEETEPKRRQRVSGELSIAPPLSCQGAFPPSPLTWPSAHTHLGKLLILGDCLSLGSIPWRGIFSVCCPAHNHTPKCYLLGPIRSPWSRAHRQAGQCPLDIR